MGGLDARVIGQEQLSILSGKLREAAPAIQRAFTRTLRTTAREGVKDVKDAAREKLPKAGGLNEWVAAANFGIRIRASGKSASLRIVATKPGHDIGAFDRGRIRHPVFANRNVWAIENVTPGFWSETLDHERDDITRHLINDMSHYTSELRHL